MLQLENCLQVKISKISGGQHKRVSIAQELLSKPDVLVLDEPTSGLDSMTCYRTVMALKNLALMSKRNEIKPLAIVLTIHQPEVQVYELFDKVYFLSSIGRSIYEGRPEDTMDIVTDTLPYLDHSNYRHCNPASLLIEIASKHHGIEAANIMADLQVALFNARMLKYIDEDNSSLQANSSLQGDLGCDLDNKTPDDCTSLKVTSNIVGGVTGSLHTLNSIGDTKKKKSVSSNCRASKRGGTLSRPLLQEDDQELFASNINDSIYNLNDIDSPENKQTTVYLDPRMVKKEDQRSDFWTHTNILRERIFKSTMRDHKLTTTKLVFSAVMPLFMYLIYSTKSGSINPCPFIDREVDIIDMSNVTVEKAEIMNEQAFVAMENMTFFFIFVYGSSLCALALTALSFPLNMHVLMKETRNGWYTSRSFLLAKTMADAPADIAIPFVGCIAMYKLTGQAASPYEWRLLIIALTITLCTVISQTQGLIYGALLMNKVETAVFLSQAMTMPAVLMSGFVIRIVRLPLMFRILSYSSIYRWGIEIIAMARYGFNICPCDPKQFEKEIDYVGFPARLRVYAYRAMEGFKRYKDRYNSAIVNNKNLGSLNQYVEAQIPMTIDGETFDTYFPEDGNHEEMEDIFYNLAEQFSAASNLGKIVKSCDDVRPIHLNRYEYDENNLASMIMGLIFLLLFMRISLFFVVDWALKNN